ncbi:unnamed protein product [Mytilus edulis]|uniref:Uncharacterized protein n=1 Tax=Mytilus edulis TaxID=6550 RepID=A0A8S3TUY5_MYTED|nr:unnamed protein product [Mytilus edulis]
MTYEDYLQSIYYNPEHPGSLGGVEKLYRAVRKEGKFVLAKIKRWLEKQDSFTLHRQINRKFKRRRFKTPTRKRLLFSESLSPVFGPENGQNVADLNEQEGISIEWETEETKEDTIDDSPVSLFEEVNKLRVRLYHLEAMLIAHVCKCKYDQEIISIEWETEETKEDTIDDSPVILFEEVNKLRVRLYHLRLC